LAGSALQTRFEQALVREAGLATVMPDDRAPAITEGAAMLLTRASRGRPPEGCRATIGAYWRAERFETEAEARIRKEFGKLIPAADYKARLDRLLYEEQNAAATRNAKYLNSNEIALAAGVIAVDNEQAYAALKAVPAAKRKDRSTSTPRRAISASRTSSRRLRRFSAPATLPSSTAMPVGRARIVARALLTRAMRDRLQARIDIPPRSRHQHRRGRVPRRLVRPRVLNDPATARKHSRDRAGLADAAQPVAGNRSRAARRPATAMPRSAPKNSGKFPTTFYARSPSPASA
jgi:hypothetical protein